MLAAVQDTKADVVMVLARQRSYVGQLFQRSVTARLLAHCPAPVLVPVLPIAAEMPSGDSTGFVIAVQNATAVLNGLASAS